MMKKDKANIPVLCFTLAFISLVSLVAHSQESTGVRSKNGPASEAKRNDAEAEPTNKPVPAKPEDVRLAVSSWYWAQVRHRRPAVYSVSHKR